MISGTCYVKDLATQCHIGCNATERKTTQPILIDIICHVDLTDALRTDRRSDCVDYVALQRIALEAARACAYHLLESLAFQIATQALALPHVQEVRVDIRKPYKLAGSREVGISILAQQKSSHAT